MTAGLILALVAGAVGLLANWVLKRRDEARVGGAAERQLRADLRQSLTVLRTAATSQQRTGSSQGCAWLPGTSSSSGLCHGSCQRSGSESKVWCRHWVPCRAWAQVNLNRAAESSALPPREIVAVRDEVVRVIGDLDRRHNDWMRWRPWLREDWPLRRAKSASRSEDADVVPAPDTETTRRLSRARKARHAARAAGYAAITVTLIAVAAFAYDRVHDTATAEQVDRAA